MGRSQGNIIQRILSVSVEPAAFILFFYLIINRFIFGGGWLQISVSTFEKVYMEIFMWILDGILFLRIAYQKKNSRDYLVSWKMNWILLAFILFATCSIIWSEFPAVTIYKVIVLIFCSAIGSYMGVTYPISILLKKIAIFFAVIILLSYGLALVVPDAGTHVGWPYFGAWRGLFFHKNYLGTMMAFSTAVSSISFFNEKTFLAKMIHASIFGLATGLIILSKSATGVILLLILNAGVLVILAWLKLRERLQKKHYILTVISLIIGLTLVFYKLDFLLGLLGKETSLTGRLPMWSFLVNYGMTHHSVIGSGLGALWAIDSFRHLVLAKVNWGIPSLSSDNGFVDIFLHLGSIGEILLIGSFAICSIRVLKLAVREKTIISIFPMVTIAFLFVVNISVSYLLEFELFGWFLLVLSMFSTVRTHITGDKINI